MHVVYILQSQKTGKYYCGETASFDDRLKRHNGGRSKSTKTDVPWSVIRLIESGNRSEARVLESKIKKRGIGRWLCENP